MYPAAEAAQPRLPRPLGLVTTLLDSVRRAGAHEQAAAVADRMPTAGMVGLYLNQHGPRGSVPTRAGDAEDGR